MFVFQDFNIIDGKGCLCATSFMNKFSFFLCAHKKRPSFQARPVVSDDIYKSLFDLEFVTIGFLFIQILAPAAKNKAICGFLVHKILPAE